MKRQIETITTLLLISGILLVGCGGCATKQTKFEPHTEQVDITSDTQAQETAQTPMVKVVPEDEKSEPVEKLTLSDEEARDILFNSGHAHSDPGVDYTQIPESPPGDTFFPTIQFPTTPPKRVHGHYSPFPAKYPFPIPEFVKENPDHFFVDEGGWWSIKYTSELEEKLEREVYLEGLKGDAFAKRYAEVVSEGLDPLPAAVFVLKVRLGDMGKAEAKVRFEQALAENPDDFHALRYLSTLIKSDRPAEAEAMKRRAVALRPESFLALNSLGSFIADTYDNETDLREAIPYLEKAYHLNSERFGPLLKLGEIYFKLGKYQKSLKYFQAVQVFRGGPGDTSSFYIALIKRGLANTAKQQGENK